MAVRRAARLQGMCSANSFNSDAMGSASVTMRPRLTGQMRAITVRRCRSANGKIDDSVRQGRCYTQPIPACVFAGARPKSGETEISR